MIQGNKGKTDTGGVDCTTVSFSIKLQLLKSVFSGYIKQKCYMKQEIEIFQECFLKYILYSEANTGGVL